MHETKYLKITFYLIYTKLLSALKSSGLPLENFKFIHLDNIFLLYIQKF